LRLTEAVCVEMSGFDQTSNRARLDATTNGSIERPSANLAYSGGLKIKIEHFRLVQ